VFDQIYSITQTDPKKIHYNIMMFGYGLLGDLESAKNVLDEMNEKSVAPGTDTFNTLMTIYAKNGRVDESFQW
jgi:pentatricopeptide repeat protein